MLSKDFFLLFLCLARELLSPAIAVKTQNTYAFEIKNIEAESLKV